MHHRKLIRDAVAVRLADLPTTQDRVYSGRARLLAQGHKPALLIYAREEQSDRGLEGQPGSIGRLLLLVIEGRVSEAAADDLLDRIAEEVEARMRDAELGLDLGGLIFDATLMRTEIDVQAEGDRVIGSIRLGYGVRYNDPAEDE